MIKYSHAVFLQRQTVNSLCTLSLDNPSGPFDRRPIFPTQLSVLHWNVITCHWHFYPWFIWECFVGNLADSSSGTNGSSLAETEQTILAEKHFPDAFLLYSLQDSVCFWSCQLSNSIISEAINTDIKIRGIYCPLQTHSAVFDAQIHHTDQKMSMKQKLRNSTFAPQYIKQHRIYKSKLHSLLYIKLPHIWIQFTCGK